MKYIELFSHIKEPIFSLQDLRLAKIKVLPYQLSAWVNKGYLRKLKNGLYIFKDRDSDVEMEEIAYNLYQPSYVSLEWALSKYGIIPEMVYHCTSVTSKTTRTFENDFGSFSYRHVKKTMFFGYRKQENDGRFFLMAEPEKAFLDFLYFNADKIKNKDDVEELRFNMEIIKGLDHNKIQEYMSVIGGRKLKRVYKIIMK